jgi:hypothetical protein
MSLRTGWWNLNSFTHNPTERQADLLEVGKYQLAFGVGWEFLSLVGSAGANGDSDEACAP